MILFSKAIIRGGARDDLFAVPVLVDAYTRKDGTYVPPHASVRHKAPEQHAAPPAAAAPPPKPAPPADPPDPPLPPGFPEGTHWVHGRGQLGTGKIALRHPTITLGNFMDSPEAAEREARSWLASHEATQRKKAAQAEADAELVARLRGGGEVTDADLKRLDLKPQARFDYLSPVVQRLFGISKPKVRQAMGDALRQTENGMNTAIITVGSSKRALKNAAAFGQPIAAVPLAQRQPDLSTLADAVHESLVQQGFGPLAEELAEARSAGRLTNGALQSIIERARDALIERDQQRREPQTAPETPGADTFTISPIQDPAPSVDEAAPNSDSVAEAPAQPAADPPPPAERAPIEDRLARLQQRRDTDGIEHHTFERFGDAANAFGGAPFTAQELADRWHGHYADDVLDQLHARPEAFALLTDGRWQRMDAYLASEDRAGEMTRLSDAIAADHPDEHRERWRAQLHRLAESMAQQPPARSPSAAPVPDDDLDPSSPNYRYRDTGYIAGSRKEMAAESIRAAARSGRRVRATDVDWSELEQNPREAAALITKANLFGDVDWQALRDAGVEPAAGFLISRIYASVGAAPAEENAQGRVDYAVAIDSLRDRIEQCRTVADVADTLQAIKDERDGVTLNAEEAHAYDVLTAAYRDETARVRAIYDQAEELHRRAAAVENEAGKLRWDLEKRRSRKWKVDPADDAELAARQASATSLRKLYADFRNEHGMNPIATATKDERSSTTRFHYPFREKLEKIGALRRGFMEGVVARNRAENSMTRAWHALGGSFKGVIDYRSSREGSDAFAKHMATAKAGRIRDWDWAERKREVKGSTRQGTRFQLMVADVHERVGGRPVPVDSTSALKSAFALRDVQSGHWVLEDPNSAKFHVEAAAAAFSDLADLLGVPDSHLAMKGRLGLAFGARGQGSRTGVAHYDPTHRVINMTKMAGGGSLAHEWFHFLDNIVIEAATGQPAGNDDYATEGGAGRLPAHLEAPVRKLVSAMMDGSHRATESMSYTAADARWAEHNLSPMQGGRSRSVIRNAASMQDAVDAIDQMHAAGAFGVVGRPKTKRAHADWRKLALIWHAEKERQAAGAGEDVPRVATFARGRGMSAFLRDAVELDEGTSGKYWSQPKELAARAFSAWAEDKLEAAGRRNTYLVALANNEPYRPLGQRPFPEGEERSRIVAAFDEFLATLRADGTLAKALASLAA